MAQSPETKAASPNPSPVGVSPANAEAASRSEADRRLQQAAAQSETVERNAAAAASSAVRQAGEAAGQATEQVGEAISRGGSTTVEMARSSVDAGAQASQRSAAFLMQEHRELLDETTERLEKFGSDMARTALETVSGLRGFMVPPESATESFRDFQETAAGVVKSLVESNVRATRDILRMADPGAVFHVQRRFIQDYIDTWMQGTSTVLRVARQTADRTLRPLEARIQQRQHERQANGVGGDGHRAVVADVMTAHVRLATPDDTVQQATRMMRDEDTGVLPVGEGDRLVGMVTDRDIALRLVAEGKDPTRTKVREVMSADVRYVFEDEDLDHVADNMAEQHLRRLPVMNRSKRLVGVISMGDLARAGASSRRAGRALRGVSREGGGQLAGAAD